MAATATQTNDSGAVAKESEDEPKAPEQEEPLRRMQLEFSLEAFERLRVLKQATGATSNAEVVRRALRLYDFVNARTQEGFRVQLENERGEVKEIVLLA